MANRIKGITVEIDGNTTKLTDALRKVNTQVSRTSTALKDVERLLKLDPTNTELLRQKQQLLAESITATKDKLEELHKAEKQAKEQMENGKMSTDQYRAIQREIVDTEQKLKKLEEQAKSAAKSLGDKMQEAGEKVKKAGEAVSGAGDKISSVGKGLTKSLTVPLAAAGTAAVKFASDYEENLNKVEASFKGNAREVKEWAKTATESFGMSESAALEATSLFGDMGTSMGLTTKEAASMSTSLAGLAGDLSSFKNLGIDEAMTALKGVFTGETESLKTLGVVMTETNLKQFASDCGLVYDGMSQAEKVTLRYNYVLANTKNAQGDYKKTADGTANSIRTLQAEAANLAATFGREMLPSITPLIQGATEMVKKFGELDSSTKQGIIKAGALVAAIGPVTTAVGTATSGIGKLINVAGNGIVAAGKFTNALAGGSGLASALGAALGPAGAAGLAVAGAASVAAGTVLVINAIDKALDPIRQMENALKDAADAQERMGTAGNIVELSDRYAYLRDQLNNTTLSASKLEEIEAELDDVRSQLNAATNGAVSAEGDYNTALDATVEIQKDLAEIEQQRANQDLYESLKDGANDYKQGLIEIKLKQEELAEAEEHLKAVAENSAKSSTDAYGELQDALEEIRENISSGVIDTDTENGVKDLRDALDDLETKVYDLTGVKVSFDGLADAESKIEDLAIDTDSAADSAMDAADRYNELDGELTELKNTTAEYEKKVISLVQNGYLSAENGAKLLGLSTDALGRKMTAYWNETHKAETGTMNLAEDQLEAAEAAEQQANAEAAATKSLAAVGEAAYDALNAGGDLTAAYEDLTKQAEQYTDTANAQTVADTERALKMLEVAATTQELGKAYGEMGVEIDGTLSDMAAYLVETDTSVDEFASGVQSMRDSVVNNFQSIKNENALTADEIVSNLEYNLQAQQQWSQNLSDMWAQAYADQNTNVMAYINYLAQMGPEYAAEVQSFANAGYSKLQEAADIWSQIGEQSTSDYAAGIYMQQYLAGEAGTAIGQEALTAAGNQSYDDVGQQIAGGTASAITSQSGVVAAAGKDLGMAAHSAVASISWTNLGDAIATGISNGITSGEGQVTGAAQDLATATTSVWMSNGGKFQNSGSTAVARIRAGMMSQSGSIRQAGQTLATAVNTIWAGQAGRFQQSGRNAGTRIRAGLLSLTGDIRAAGQTLATSVQSAWEAMMGTFYAEGNSAAVNLANGIYSGRGTVTGAASNVIYAARGAMQIGGWYDLGYNISAGVADGVRGGSYLITQAANAAAQNALASAKRSLGVHSPSRVFRDEVGKMISAGMAEGITDNESMVSKAIRALNTKITGGVGTGGMAALGLSGSCKNTTIAPVINVYGASGQNVNDLADAVADRLSRLVRRGSAALA